jgi:glycogen(starch) synthase
VEARHVPARDERSAMPVTDLRIAWLTENYPPSRGGMAQSCDRIVRGLRAVGVEVDLLHVSARLQRWEERRQLGGRYFGCPLRSDPSHTLNRLWTRLEADDAGYDCVVAFGGNLPMLAGPVFSAWLSRPLVTLIRGNDFDAAVFNPRRAQVLREALAASEQVCCVSRDKLRRIRALYPQTRGRWIPNGIDEADWQAQPFDRERSSDWRRRFVPDGRRVLGLFGHLKAKKGLLFFLETLLRSGRQSRFHLLLVGDITPEAVQWLEAHQERLSVTPLPFLDRYDLIPYLLACDFAVLPSFYDGMPNVMLEALSLGVPLLASRVGGMADVLEDGVHGYLFDAGDAPGCRHALCRAADAADGQREAMVTACRQLAREQLNAEREIQTYLEVFQATAAGETEAGSDSVLVGRFR